MVKGEVLVGIVMGSDSDFEVLKDAVRLLEQLEIPCEVVVASAHRSPDRARQYVKEAEPRGLKVLIAGAGGAAALPGFLAAETILPVIGVPIASTPLGGLDSILSMAQMPRGVPVATVAIGSWGASNAALLAAEIIALSDDAVKKRLLAYKAQLASGVEESSKRLEERIKRKA